MKIWKTAAVLAIAILAQASGNTLLSKEMRFLASPQREWFVLLLLGAENPMIWLATGLLAVFFFLYASALSWADLSLVLPATSFGYVVNEAFAYFFLNEPVSAKKWIATVLICAGVAIVGRSGIQGVNSR